jgi:hypothetical protein
MRFLRLALIALLANACNGLIATDSGPPGAREQKNAIAADAGIDAARDLGSDGGGAGAGGSVLFSGEPAYTLFVDGTDLFFTVAAMPIRVKKCSIDDCSAPTLIGSGGDGLPGIAVDAKNVYWSANFSNTVLKSARTGAGNAVELATPKYARGIASDGSDVFYNAEGAVWKCAAAGCAVPTKLVGTPWDTNGIAIDADNVYFTSTNGGVGMCAKSGCESPTILAPGPYGGADIAVDATDVYWATQSGGVFRCAIAGCNGSPVTVTPSQSWSLAIDEANVYFTTLHAIMKCTKSGCVEPTVIASDQFAPADIVVDATSVYWTNRADIGEIRKAQKN